METNKSEFFRAISESTSWSSDCFSTAQSSRAVQPDFLASPCTCARDRRFSSALAEVIRRQRLLRGVSQQTLAHITGLDRGYLISIEHARRNPSVSTLLLIAEGLEMRASDLLSLVEEAFADHNAATEHAFCTKKVTT